MASKRRKPDPNAVHYPARNGPACGQRPAPVDASRYSNDPANVTCIYCEDGVDLDGIAAANKKSAAPTK